MVVNQLNIRKILLKLGLIQVIMKVFLGKLISFLFFNYIVQCAFQMENKCYLQIHIHDCEYECYYQCEYELQKICKAFLYFLSKNY